VALCAAPAPTNAKSVLKVPGATERCHREAAQTAENGAEAGANGQLQAHSSPFPHALYYNHIYEAP